MLDRIVLFPYYFALRFRNEYYRNRGQKSEVPTICLGNITVGGTGKTPHTEMILDILQQSDEWGGRNIAVLSRGYKRKSKGFQMVGYNGPASEYGDEPLQIKRKFPAVSVAVDRNRVEGCDLLVHPEKVQSGKYKDKVHFPDFPAADIIVLDDAFQYRKLRPDVNIVLVDYSRPIDEDRLLPLGNLRDLRERISEADIVIVSKCPRAMDPEEKKSWADRLGVAEEKMFFTYIKYSGIIPMYDSADRHYVYSKKAIMFTGIARDTAMQNYLSGIYKILQKFSFGDHHKYSKGDFHSMLAVVKKYPAAALITTEKDAMRAYDFQGVPEMLKERMFYLPIQVDFLEYGDRERFTSRLLKSISGR